MDDRHRSGSHNERKSDKHSSKHISRHHEHRPKHSRLDATDQDRSQSRTSGKQKAHPPKQDLTSFSDGEHFASDRKGDPGILSYGTIHSYQVPSYRRIGYGYVLGLSRHLKIDRSQSSSKELHVIQSGHQSSKRDKAMFARTANLEEYRIRPSGQDFLEDLDKNFLAFQQKRQRKDHGPKTDSEDTSEDDSVDYRSIKGKAKASDLIDKDLELNQSIEEYDLYDKDAPDAQLQRKVEIEPQNGQAWLDLIRHKFQFTGHQTHAERVSTAEIKTSMYEKALKHVTGTIRESLLSELLKEATLLWDQKKIQNKWLDILRDNKSSFLLWKDYLNHRQTNPVSFKFDDVKETYKECFNVFKTTLVKKETTEMATHLIYLLLRFTVFLRESGYGEQAIAIWQANIERHTSKQTNGTSISKQEVESFWDSEVARIGEPTALGLSHYRKHGGDPPAETEDMPPPDEERLDILSWLTHETNQSDLLPARTMDTTDEEDAFRVVLFSDIQPFLLDLPTETNETLLDALLLFCGLPLLWQTESRHWNDDPLIHRGAWESAVVVGDEQVKEAIKGSIDSQYTSSSSCRITTDVLFARLSPFACFSADNPVNGTTRQLEEDKRPIQVEWIHNILHHLTTQGTGFDRFRLIEYYLAFELHFYPQRVRKSSKNILRTYPQHLPLYNTHALIEYRLGHFGAAEKVLQTAMRMRPDDPDVISLRRTLAWEALENDQASMALVHLVQGSAVHDEAAIVRLQSDWLAGRDTAISQSNISLVSSYIDCLVLLSYLMNPKPLNAALAVFESNLSLISTRLQVRPACVEILHQNLARLLQYHMSHQQYKPSVIRKTIQQSMAIFPTNTIFLTLFQLNEQRYRINDRVRSVVSAILSHQQETSDNLSPLIGHLFAIQTELARTLSLGSGTEATRSVFERALQDPQTKSSPLLWLLYIKFELAQNHDRVMSVASRSLAACPWVRDFYLLTIKLTRQAKKFAESQGAYEMLVDRELRLHLSLQEKFWR